MVKRDHWEDGAGCGPCDLPPLRIPTMDEALCSVCFNARDLLLVGCRARDAAAGPVRDANSLGLAHKVPSLPCRRR